MMPSQNHIKICVALTLTQITLLLVENMELLVAESNMGVVTIPPGLKAKHMVHHARRLAWFHKSRSMLHVGNEFRDKTLLTGKKI